MKIIRLTKPVANLHPLIAGQVAFPLVIPKHTVANGDLISVFWDTIINIPEDPLNLTHAIVSTVNFSVQLDDNATPPASPANIITGNTYQTGPAPIVNDIIGNALGLVAGSFAIGLDGLPYAFTATTNGSVQSPQLDPTVTIDRFASSFTVETGNDGPYLFPKDANPYLFTTLQKYGYRNTGIDWNINHTLYFIMNADADYNVTFPTYQIQTKNARVIIWQPDNGNTASS